MDFIDIVDPKSMSGVALGGFFATVAWLFKRAGKDAVLRNTVELQQRMLDDLVTGKFSHETRITLVERAVQDIQKITPALDRLTSKMDGLLIGQQQQVDNALRRLDILENHVITQTQAARYNAVRVEDNKQHT